MKRDCFRVSLLIGLALITAFSPLAQAPAATKDPETTAEVPALDGLHEIIYPLWHTAWPGKDFKMMKELLPEAEKQVQAVQKAELPGILRDKKADWDSGVAGLTKSLEAYKKAAAGNDEKGLLNAVEGFHASFERLIRIAYPKMNELDAYHQVLYQIYHRDWPAKQLDALAGSAGKLAERCAALQGASIPRRFAAKEADLKAAFKVLCADTAALVEASKGSDQAAIGKAVEKVHAQYQSVEGMFK